MSSVSKQPHIRPAQQGKKRAAKVVRIKPITTPVGDEAVMRKKSPQSTKRGAVSEAIVEDDLSDLVPSREVRSAVLKLSKVDPEWLDDAYSSTKPKKK